MSDLKVWELDDDARVLIEEGLLDSNMVGNWTFDMVKALADRVLRSLRSGGREIVLRQIAHTDRLKLPYPPEFTVYVVVDE